jgi:hypothetical protein
MNAVVKLAVIPNEVRDLANCDGSRNEICVTKASIVRSFSRACGIRMTRIVL